MLVDSIEVFPVEEGNSNDPTTFNVGTSQATSDSHVISRKSQEQNGAPISISQLLSSRKPLTNRVLDNVFVTDLYVAGALSTYLMTSHPMLRLFDAELSLNDAIQTKNEFCSEFLVNCLLTLASQLYCKTDPTAAGKSLEI
jgi:hypothetical protein